MKKISIVNLIKNIDSRIKLIFLFSAILLTVFFMHIRINSQKNNQTGIILIPDDNIKLSSLQINIEYNEDERDEIFIKTFFHRDIAEKGGSKLYIETDDKIEPTDQFISDKGCDYHRKKMDGKNIEYINNENGNCGGFQQFYRGAIFEKYNSEINNHIYFGYGSSPESLNDLPQTTIGIYNISNFNINSIYPQPDDYNIYSVEYKNPDKIRTIFNEGIKLSAEHKFKKYSNQNWIFVFGLVIGGLFSGIIELIIDFRRK